MCLCCAGATNFKMFAWRNNSQEMFSTFHVPQEVRRTFRTILLPKTSLLPNLLHPLLSKVQLARHVERQKACSQELPYPFRLEKLCIKAK